MITFVLKFGSVIHKETLRLRNYAYLKIFDITD